MESIDENFSKSAFGISETSRQNLLETSKWSLFLSIVGFIGLGLMLIGSLMFISMANEINSFSYGRRNDFPLEGLGLIYIIMTILFFFPVYYLFKFAITMKAALGSSNPIGFDEATGFLKSHYKFNGFMTIIIMSIYALLLFVGMFAAMTGM